jgi:hypothetical protein
MKLKKKRAKLRKKIARLQQELNEMAHAADKPVKAVDEFPNHDCSHCSRKAGEPRRRSFLPNGRETSCPVCCRFMDIPSTAGM